MTGTACHRAPSLARRLIVSFTICQAMLSLLATLTEPLWEGWPRPWGWLAAEQARQLLENSLSYEEDGRLIFRPTAEMTGYMAEARDFWFLVADGEQMVTGGTAKAFQSSGDQRLGAGPGATVGLHVGASELGVLMGGAQGDTLTILWVWISDRLPHWALRVAIICLVTTLLIIGIVHLLLRPVRRAAQAAAALSPGMTSPALPEDGVPAEILPLVTATNGAFERLEREHERHRRFIANAAHELRTPIAILSIRLDELPEGASKQRLMQDVTRLTLLANQLLDLERLNHGGAQQHELIDLVILIRETAAKIGPLAVARGSTISFHSALPRLRVMGDDQALRGVFTNLLDNALSHGGTGVQIDLDIRADGSIEVADQGPGMPTEMRERAFEAFQRGGSGGSGLGLYIVHEILKAHDARIELLDGRPGTVFRIRF